MKLVHLFPGTTCCFMVSLDNTNTNTALSTENLKRICPLELQKRKSRMDRKGKSLQDASKGLIFLNHFWMLPTWILPRKQVKRVNWSHNSPSSSNYLLLTQTLLLAVTLMNSPRLCHHFLMKRMRSCENIGPW